MVLCFVKENRLGVGWGKMVLCFIKENGLSNDEFSSMSLGQYCTLSATLGLQHPQIMCGTLTPPYYTLWHTSSVLE